MEYGKPFHFQCTRRIGYLDLKVVSLSLSVTYNKRVLLIQGNHDRKEYLYEPPCVRKQRESSPTKFHPFSCIIAVA